MTTITWGSNKKRYRVEDEQTGLGCGFDYQSFVWGFDCKRAATKVIIEGIDFHYAHLCEKHILETMKALEFI